MAGASRISCRAASGSAWRWPAPSPSSRRSCCSTSRLGALDKKLREQTQFELMNIQHKLGVTFVVVTHDQEEAMIARHPHRRDGQRQDPPDRHADRCLRVSPFPLRRRLHRLDQSVRRQHRGYRAGPRRDRHARDRRRASSPNAVDGLARGATVAVAVRPEKIRIERLTAGHQRQCLSRPGPRSRLFRQGFALPRQAQLRRDPPGQPGQRPARRRERARRLGR